MSRNRSSPFNYEHTLTSEILGEEKDCLKKLEKKLSDLMDGTITSIIVRFQKDGKLQFKTVTVNDKAWSKTLKMEISECESDIRGVKAKIRYFEGRLFVWRYQEIVGIDFPPTGRLRGLKPAYDPEREEEENRLAAKRAERAAKPGKIRIKLYWEISSAEDFYISDGEKKVVRAWVKTLFKNGKNRVCEGHGGELPRQFREKLQQDQYSTQVIIIHADWSYRDEIASMMPNLTRLDISAKEIEFVQDVSNGKPWA